MARVAQVAVEGVLYHFDKLYSYLVPEAMATLAPGCRVRVNFGRGNLRRQAVVLGISHQEDTAKLKAVLEQIDGEPILGEEALFLLRTLREQTFCTWFDALRLLIPGGLGIVFKTLYIATGEGALLTQGQREIVEYVAAKKDPVGEERLRIAFALEGGELEELCALGALQKLEESRRQLLDDKVTMLRLVPGWEEIPLTPKQKQAATFLAEHETASLKELCYYTGVSRGVVQALGDKGAAEFYDRVSYRNPYAGAGAQPAPKAAVLSPAQEKAFLTLKGLLGGTPKKEAPPRESWEKITGGNLPDTALLYGVTGSGKTQVYLRLLEEVLALGKTALVLVPEISLTAQTLESFHARFGSRVAVLHSGLSLGERMDEWRRINEGGAEIVVGTRSAVFAPVKNLGLVVLDEEQEHTYKSDKTPRYHAREIARIRCKYHGALLVLASATPSIESYYHAQTGRYALVALEGRYGGNRLPAVETVDMGRAENLSDTPALSLPLREELWQNLQEGQQSILLLNRRGHSTLVRCSACGQVAGCPSCSVALTYHAANGALLCHYCGYQAPRAASCSACGSKLVRYSGAGTQRLEEELKVLFPDARVLRVDMDTTMSKFSHQRHFAAFAAGEYDIMIGTQMVAKGLNFPKVTLVGVLNTDNSLYNSDFRSFERTFALLTQVVGRGGRGELGGRAIIQTYSPEHPVIELASRQDYPAFYKEEVHSRKLHLYPPFCTLAGIGFSGASQVETLKAARAFLERFRALASGPFAGLPLRMLGPVAANVFKAAGKFRYRLLLKCRNDQKTRALLAQLLEWFYGEVKQVSVFIDLYYDGY